ncbi:MAG UNVERIFIED_CONTAM: hypothetical protein LVR29_06630 [Microcystis novacekii LVE1205-3]
MKAKLSLRKGFNFSGQLGLPDADRIMSLPVSPQEEEEEEEQEELAPGGKKKKLLTVN